MFLNMYNYICDLCREIKIVIVKNGMLSLVFLLQLVLALMFAISSALSVGSGMNIIALKKMGNFSYFGYYFGLVLILCAFKAVLGFGLYHRYTFFASFAGIFFINYAVFSAYTSFVSAEGALGVINIFIFVLPVFFLINLCNLLNLIKISELRGYSTRCGRCPNIWHAIGHATYKCRHVLITEFVCVTIYFFAFALIV